MSLKAKTRTRVLTLYPIHVALTGIGYAAYSIAVSMNSESLNCEFYCPSSSDTYKDTKLNNLIPSILKPLLYKILPDKYVIRITEYLFCRKVKGDDIVHLWPGTSLWLFHWFKKRGNLIILENINCHRGISKKLLDNEQLKLNSDAIHSITPESIKEEELRLQYADFIFSPSPNVLESLVQSGVARSKILLTSYGLKQSERIGLSDTKFNSDNTVTAIFVGRVGIRKGVHLLLEYWCEANVKGDLKIIGSVEDSIKPILKKYCNYENIKFIDYTPNLIELYAKADMFLFPSIEEGSPLVTYLALGAGLPCLVSPMGGEGVVRDEKDGYIIEPHNKKQWVSAIRKISADIELRKSFALNSYANSKNFIWENVGRTRAEVFLNALENKTK